MINIMTIHCFFCHIGEWYWNDSIFNWSWSQCKSYIDEEKQTPLGVPFQVLKYTKNGADTKY